MQGAGREAEGGKRRARGGKREARSGGPRADDGGQRSGGGGRREDHGLREYGTTDFFTAKYAKDAKRGVGGKRKLGKQKAETRILQKITKRTK